MHFLVLMTAPLLRLLVDPTLADVKTAAEDLGIWWVVAVGILITLAVLLVRRARRA